MHHRFTRRAAFSLVEMAIVIVIVGLLAGGIIATRSYIRNSELATMMAETRYYINALGQFQTQYKALPGDMDNATSFWGVAAGGSGDNYTTSCYGTPNTGNQTCNGDGNGLISSGAVPNAAETILALKHLSLAGFITGTYTGVGDGGTLNATPGLNTPTSVVQGVTYLYYHMSPVNGNVTSGSIPFSGVYNNVLLVAGANNPQTGGVPNTPFMSPKEAYELDRKFDDGLPGNGMIVTPKSSWLPNCATTDVVSTAIYNTTSTTKNCYFMIRIP